MKALIDCPDEPSVSLRALKDLIPEGSIVSSYLFYSGAIEFGLCESNRFLVAKTDKHVVKQFWDCIMEDPGLLHQIVSSPKMKLVNDRMFYLLQETWSTYPDPYIRSALFFYLSSCSDKGYVSFGEITKLQIDPFKLSRLKKFKVSNFHIEQAQFDYEKISDTIMQDGNCDYSLFSVGRFSFNFFGEGRASHEITHVDHKKLRESIGRIQNKNVVVVYKYNEQVLRLYEGYSIIMVDKYGNVASSTDKCEEIIVTNF
jgi:hypothetical protein